MLRVRALLLRCVRVLQGIAQCCTVCCTVRCTARCRECCRVLHSALQRVLQSVAQCVAESVAECCRVLHSAFIQSMSISHINVEVAHASVDVGRCVAGHCSVSQFVGEYGTLQHAAIYCNTLRHQYQYLGYSRTQTYTPNLSRSPTSTYVHRYINVICKDRRRQWSLKWRRESISRGILEK